MLPIVLIVTALVAAVTALPVWRNPVWWVRGCDFLRLQVIVLAVVGAGSAVLFLELGHHLTWGLLAVLLVCLVIQAWWIVPYSPLYPTEVKTAAPGAASRIRIVTANVLTPNRQSAALLSLIRREDPDVVVTLESDDWWESQLSVLEPAYPHRMACPQDNLYGMHVYSRLPLSECGIEFLVEDDVPSMHAVVTLPGGHAVRVHFLHPAPPSPTQNVESSERDAELLLVGKSVAESASPVIVAGDLNDVAWSATTRLFRKISGLLDPRIGRGMFNTYHALRWYMRWPLDHLFHSAHFTMCEIRRLPAFGSDHFPLLAELAFEPRQVTDQAGPAADRSDRQWARDKMDRHAVSPDDLPTPGE